MSMWKSQVLMASALLIELVFQAELQFYYFYVLYYLTRYKLKIKVGLSSIYCDLTQV